MDEAQASVEAGNAFEKWANANRSKIHADALDEAAMGFKAGWEAALPETAAREAALVATIESLRQDEEHFDEFCREVGECSPGCKRLTAALADTSPAAAALLAQGEELKRIAALPCQYTYAREQGGACTQCPPCRARAALSPSQGEQ